MGDRGKVRAVASLMVMWGLLGAGLVALAHWLAIVAVAMIITLLLVAALGWAAILVLDARGREEGDDGQSLPPWAGGPMPAVVAPPPLPAPLPTPLPVAAPVRPVAPPAPPVPAPSPPMPQPAPQPRQAAPAPGPRGKLSETYLYTYGKELGGYVVERGNDYVGCVPGNKADPQVAVKDFAKRHGVEPRIVKVNEEKAAGKDRVYRLSA
jgi:hypothetical protein